MDGMNFRTICNELKNLRELSLDRCDFVEPSAFSSLKQIKGLKKLSLFSCSQMTMKTVTSLTFLELISLQIEKMEAVRNFFTRKRLRDLTDLFLDFS